MRLMVIVKANKNSEAGILPSEKLLNEMGKFNEELVKAGVMVAGDGLQPSVKGKRVVFAGGRRAVVDGPFAEAKELVAGYWIWRVSSMEEAVSWAQRCPDPMPGEEAVLELRPLYELEDFGDNATPEVRERESRLRAEIEARASARMSKLRVSCFSVSLDGYGAGPSPGRAEPARPRRDGPARLVLPHAHVPAHARPTGAGEPR